MRGGSAEGEMSLETVTTITPERSRSDAVQKRRRRQDPGLLDKRKVNGRRVVELKAIYAAELVKAGIELTPVRLVQIETAAAAQVTAEVGRRRFLEEGVGKLSDLIAAERRADMAIKRILPPDKSAARRHDDGQAALAAHLARAG